MKNFIIASIIVIISFTSYSQSLFESTISSDEGDNKKVEINGYVRTDIFANESDYRSAYGETSLKLETNCFKYGNAFSEVRLRKEFTDGSSRVLVDLREAYINLYLSDFDFRIGKQIIVWGRADGFNPTNNLTPYDYTFFSPEEDDKRLSNFVVSGDYNLYPFELSANWIPVYKSAILPFGKATLPNGIEWGRENFPDTGLSNSAYALKLSVEDARFDGSVSYFNGYHKLPGLCLRTTENNPDQIYLTAHHTQIIGLDFSTVISKYGLRGEFAYSRPFENEDIYFSIPESQFEYTIGIEREWGNFSLIAQYIGKTVFNFDATVGINEIGDDYLTNQMITWNRMIYGQQKDLSHSFSLRPYLSVAHQTLTFEILSLYNLSTEELFFKPQIDYHLSDNISLTSGMQLYAGPDNTLFNMLGKGLNSGFAECKISF